MGPVARTRTKRVLLQLELERVVVEYKKLEEGLAAAEQEKETLERDRAGCSKDIKQLEKHKAGFEKLLKDLAKHKDSVRKQKERLENEVENCKREIAELEKARFLVMFAEGSCSGVVRTWASTRRLQDVVSC